MRCGLKAGDCVSHHVVAVIPGEDHECSVQTLRFLRCVGTGNFAKRVCGVPLERSTMTMTSLQARSRSQFLARKPTKVHFFGDCNMIRTTTVLRARLKAPDHCAREIAVSVPASLSSALRHATAVRAAVAKTSSKTAQTASHTFSR